ncbi:glutamate decarboxylase isozyme, partial [Shigella dysenteriae]
TSKARIIHQIQLIRGITVCSMLLVSVCIMLLVMAVHGMQVYYNK